MKHEFVEIKPSLNRYLTIKILPFFVAWSIGNTVYQLFTSSFHLESWIGTILGAFIGLTVLGLLTRSYVKLTMTSNFIAGPSGQWGKTEIPYGNIDVEASTIHNNNVGFLKNYQLLAQNGNMIHVDRSFSSEQLEEVMRNIVSGQKKLASQETQLPN